MEQETDRRITVIADILHLNGVKWDKAVEWAEEVVEALGGDAAQGGER